MIEIGNTKLGEYPLLLAPMEDVSDPPFRALCKKHGADLMFTEFISSEGLIRDAHKSVQKLDIYPQERPIGIQIFGANIDSMRQAATIVEKAEPEILDINYGCPVHKVTCKGAGAGILLDLEKMQKLTEEIVKQVSLPVTVKTRLGWDNSTIKIVEVAKRLQDVGIQALTIHGRTRKQLYTGEANWDLISEVKSHPDIHIPIFGNGDIDSPTKALDYKQKYNVDGMMIGRASIGYPWIFREIKHYLKTGELLPPPTVRERVETIIEHLDFAMKWKGERLGILETRRHYTGYLRGLKNIKEYRRGLVTADTYGEILEIICSVIGNDVYGSMKFESGVHRVQRIPTTETQGRVHTSAASVIVLPEAEDVEINLDMNEIRKDTFCSSGPGGQSVNTTYSAIRLTHMPTGIVVSCQDEKSQIKNFDKALKVLKARLYEIELKKQEESLGAERRSMVRTGDRSEKIRTYNYPQGRVTDHRISYTVHNLSGIMDGDIGDIIEKLRIAENAEKLKEGHKD